MDETARLDYFETLIGRPYQIGAMGPDKFDCYGLVRHVQGKCYAYEMPDLPYAIATTRSQAEAMLSHPEREKWQQVETIDAQDGDIVLMGNVSGRDFHLGTYVVVNSLGLVLHTNPANGVVADDLPSLRSIGFNYLRIFRQCPTDADSGQAPP